MKKICKRDLDLAKECSLCTKKWTTGRLKRFIKLLHNNLVKIRS